jgi:hypothetical protein
MWLRALAAGATVAGRMDVWTIRTLQRSGHSTLIWTDGRFECGRSKNRNEGVILRLTMPRFQDCP